MNAAQRQARRRRTLCRSLALAHAHWQAQEDRNQATLQKLAQDQQRARIHAAYVQEMRSPLDLDALLAGLECEPHPWGGPP